MALCLDQVSNLTLQLNVGNSGIAPTGQSFVAENLFYFIGIKNNLNNDLSRFSCTYDADQEFGFESGAYNLPGAWTTAVWNGRQVYAFYAGTPFLWVYTPEKLTYLYTK